MKNRQSTFSNPMLSIIIPVHNEADVIPTLLKRLDLVCRQLPGQVELLFVDDGSRDDSVAQLLRARDRYSGIRVVQLSRNFGKEAAVTAGLESARGDAVVLMDADLQDPPELIPRMVQAWQQGADVVLMKRRSRAGESWLKRTTASIFYRLINHISDASIPVDTGDFRLMSRRTVDALNRLPERNRYLKGMFAWVGMPTVTLEFDRDPRLAGKTKWNYLKLMHLAMEGITSFSTRPLRIALILGLFAAGAVCRACRTARTGGDTAAGGHYRTALCRNCPHNGPHRRLDNPMVRLRSAVLGQATTVVLGAGTVVQIAGCF